MVGVLKLIVVLGVVGLTMKNASEKGTQFLRGVNLAKRPLLIGQKGVAKTWRQSNQIAVFDIRILVLAMEFQTDSVGCLSQVTPALHAWNGLLAQRIHFRDAKMT